MTVFIFILAIVWGSLSAQFLLQAIISLITSCICLFALPFSKVGKFINAGGALISLVQAIIFGALFFFGNWYSDDYINYSSHGASSIASVISFVVTIICIVPQFPGKILLARMSAWMPQFAEASNVMPRHDRVAYAKRVRASPPGDAWYK
jgi:hypothetical protein